MDMDNVTTSSLLLHHRFVPRAQDMRLRLSLSLTDSLDLQHVDRRNAFIIH